MSESLSSQDLYDAGFAIKRYTINNDRETFVYRDEVFDFKEPSKSAAAHRASVLRDTPPLVRVCAIEKLREIANG